MKVLLLILISISLITKQVKHFFKCFSAIWIFSSEICLLIFSFLFFFCLFFYYVICLSDWFLGFIFLYIMDTYLLLYAWLCHFSVDSPGFFRYIWIICKWYCTFLLIIFEGIACISRRHFANLYYSDNWTVGLSFSQLTPN